MDRALKTDREVGQARGNDMWPGAALEKFDCRCYGCAPTLTGGAPRPPHPPSARTLISVSLLHCQINIIYIIYYLIYYYVIYINF